MSWLATLALLVSALAPAISVALPAGADLSVQADICSVQDMDSAWREGKPAPMSGKMDCKLCPSSHLGQPHLGLPPAPQASPLLSTLGFALPALFLAAPRTLHAWAPAQARAPPLNV